MGKFEYKTLIYETSGWVDSKIDANEIDGKLNESARDGWELDKCFPVAESYGRTKKIVLIFKREIQ